MNIGSGFLGQSANRGITPQTMGQVLGADMVKDATNTMMSTGAQGVVNRGLEQLRQKGTMESNEFNLRGNMYRDQQTLLGQKLEYDRQFGKEGQRIDAATKTRQAEIDAATKQRGVETDAATKQRQIDADAALERDKLRIKAEADAKAGLLTTAQQQESEKIAKSNEGTIAGIMSVWDTKDKATVWDLDEDTDVPETYDETTGEALTYVKGSSVQRKMKEHRDRIMQAAKDISDPAAKAAYLTRVQNEGLLDFAKTRGLYDARFAADEAARAASASSAPAPAAVGSSR